MSSRPIRVICAICGSLSLLAGCIKLKGVRYLQGDSTVIGIGLPLEGDTVQVQAYSGLSGQRLEVDRDAAVTIDCATAQTNSYFGVVRTESAYTMKATVTPNKSALSAKSAGETERTTP